MMKVVTSVIIITMVVVGVFLLQSCNKEDVPQRAAAAEMQFSISHTDFDYKDPNVVPECSEYSMDYVKFYFAGKMYTSPILFVNGEFLTKSVKLIASEGTYELSSFYVYHDLPPVGPDDDDMLIMAAPLPESEYHNLMENPLNIYVEVEAFKKKSIIIDVLCYEPLFYHKFGFSWLEINQFRILQQCISGDICVDDITDYVGSPYGVQSGDLRTVLPAIMKVEVYKGDDLRRTFSNETTYGDDAYLVVHWLEDELLNQENFTYKVSVLLPQGSGLAYQLVGEMNFEDGDGALQGSNGIVDFGIGTCVVGSVDYTFEHP